MCASATTYSSGVRLAHNIKGEIVEDERVGQCNDCPRLTLSSPTDSHQGICKSWSLCHSTFMQFGVGTRMCLGKHHVAVLLGFFELNGSTEMAAYCHVVCFLLSFPILSPFLSPHLCATLLCLPASPGHHAHSSKKKNRGIYPTTPLPDVQQPVSSVLRPTDRKRVKYQ